MMQSHDKKDGAENKNEEGNDKEKVYWDEDVLRIKNEVRRYEEEQRRIALGLPAEDDEVFSPIRSDKDG